MAWRFRSEPDAGGVTSYRLLDEDGRPVARGDALRQLAQDAAFRELLAHTLAAAHHEAFFWECPPTSRAQQEREFEFVVIPAPALAELPADPSSFELQFDRDPTANVHTFANLSGDATLVVPAPRGVTSAYGHLGAFVRAAPPDQVDTLFRSLAVAIEDRLSHAALWVSTAGFGVPWLHVRLDSRPKYYRHGPYKHAS